MTTKTCAVDGCSRWARYVTTGLCASHYHRAWRGQPVVAPTCSVDGCQEPLTAKNKKGRCIEHSYVMKSWGTCGSEGCSKRIRSDNTTGLCGPHLRELKVAEWQAERRARTAKLWVEDVDRTRVLSDHNGVCHLCGLSVGVDWQLEHVIPIADGGPHCYDNVAPSHPKCNRQKSRYRGGSPVAAIDAAACAAFLAFHGRPYR